MHEGTRVFLKIRRKPSRELLGDADVLHHQTDLLVLAWDFDFSDLADVDQAAEELVAGLGTELLYLHRDPRGVLLTPTSLQAIDAADYRSGVAVYSPAGLWAPNLAREPGVRLAAGDETEIPLPRFKPSRKLEFYVVKTARAMQELELAEVPQRTVRLELTSGASPREVSAFYLPHLKQHGLRVRRRIWSSGVAERLIGSSVAHYAFVHAEKRGPRETLIQISWVVRS